MTQLYPLDLKTMEDLGEIWDVLEKGGFAKDMSDQQVTLIYYAYHMGATRKSPRCLKAMDRLKEIIEGS